MAVSSKSAETPRALKSQQTKQKILNAALNLIKENGYENLTTKNICEYAGVSNGTFFHYYKTKDELLAQYFEAGYQLDSPISLGHDTDDVKAKTLQILSSYMRYCVHTGVAFLSNYYTPKNKALATTRTNNSASLPSYMQKTIEALVRAQKNGFIKSNIKPSDILMDLSFFSKGLVFEWCLYDGDIDLLARCQKFIDIYMGTVLTEKYWVAFPKQPQ